MALNKDCYDRPYIIGRITAYIEAYENTPVGFAGKVSTNPQDQSFSYHLRNALKKAVDESDSGFLELANMMGDLRDYHDSAGKFWLGYYHQKADFDRDKIGSAIQKKRIELGWTQTDLADRCGLSYSTISKIESGRWSASVDLLSSLGPALGLSLKFE